jgi:hypothetical protein
MDLGPDGGPPWTITQRDDWAFDHAVTVVGPAHALQLTVGRRLERAPERAP